MNEAPPTFVRLVWKRIVFLGKPRTLSATTVCSSSSRTQEARVASLCARLVGPTLEPFVHVLDFGLYFLVPHTSEFGII